MNPEVLLSRIRVVLCRPSHPGNIGAAARAMKTMGLSRLSLVSPRHFPDPVAETRATGAVDLLHAATVVSSLGEALGDSVLAVGLSARSRDLGPPPSTPRAVMPVLLQAAAQGEVALVFGNETVGLSNEEIQLCQLTVAIPTNPEFASLNLGAAVQVMSYECRMAAFGEDVATGRSEGATPFASPPATHAQIEGLVAHFQQVMTATGFFNPAQPGRLMPKLRRLLSRVQMEQDEVNILRGILGATQRPTSHGRKPE